MIKQIFAFESIIDYEDYANEIKILTRKLELYKECLVNEYELKVLPKTIVWTNKENATTVFSKVPVPAYTNEETIFMTPIVDEWKNFYLSLLEGEGVAHIDTITYIKQYFQSITIDHVFCVLAHELTHHIELFPDDFEDERNDSIWFEEGMCEYLSQKLTLTEVQFNELRKINNLMIEIFKPNYGDFPLDEFGSGSYNQISLASIMLNYWRSTAAIQYLVDDCYSGDVMKVFNLYHEWYEKGKQQPLTDFFGVSRF